MSEEQETWGPYCRWPHPLAGLDYGAVEMRVLEWITSVDPLSMLEQPRRQGRTATEARGAQKSLDLALAYGAAGFIRRRERASMSNQDFLQAMVCMEWGFRACERGLNLEAARADFTRLSLGQPALHDHPRARKQYACPVCGTADATQFNRCNRPDCPDGRDPR